MGCSNCTCGHIGMATPPLPSPGSEVKQGPSCLSLESEVSGPWSVYTFVLNVKLSLLPEASEGCNAGAWANQDARDLGISRQVEARGTGQKRQKRHCVLLTLEPRVSQVAIVERFLFLSGTMGPFSVGLAESFKSEFAGACLLLHSHHLASG